MVSMHAVMLSAGLAAATVAIPTIPTLQPAGPHTNGIVAAADGTLYFVDSFNRTIWRVTTGGVAEPFVVGRNGRSLQIDASGSIYGLHEDDDGEVTVWRADADGSVRDVARPDLPQQHGAGFVLDSDDAIIGHSGTGKRSGVRLWRAVGSDLQLIAGGQWGLRDGLAADARFFPIGAMTRTAHGDLLVTSGPTVRRVAADGSVRTVVADEPLLEARHSFLSRLLGDVQGHLTGIACGAAGEIYVTNTARGTVVRIDAAGTASVVATSGSGWKPTGVAFSSGVLYVLEYGAGVRVRRIGHGADHILAQVRPQRDAVTAAAAAGRFMRQT